tara:strand:- start:209 stop:502 length:294 start_codon:yes stop_codon:yes gene_type:complete
VQAFTAVQTSNHCHSRRQFALISEFVAYQNQHRLTKAKRKLIKTNNFFDQHQFHFQSKSIFLTNTKKALDQNPKILCFWSTTFWFWSIFLALVGKKS